jgi:hypothetical protein
VRGLWDNSVDGLAPSRHPEERDLAHFLTAQRAASRVLHTPCIMRIQVGGNDDDGYGAAERVCETDDEGGGGFGGGPAGTVTLAADLAARYQQDAEEAAAAEEAQRRRHAASGAAYFNSHGRQHGSHALLAELPLAGV